MKARMQDYGIEQPDYRLEHDKRRILNCADTFDDLAAVFSGMYQKEPEAEGETADRESLWRRSRARESGRTYAFYMKQAAGLLQAAAASDVRILRLNGKPEKQIVRALAGEGILVQDICLLQEIQGRLEICVTLCTKKKTSVTVSQIAGYLSVLMDIRLVPERRNPYFIGQEPVCLYFEEEPAFCYLSASATAVRENETVSGDSFSFFEEDGKVSVILSDGVGSGEEAAADSGRVVDLAERILDAGLGCQAAADMLNGMICAGEDESRMPTLDLCRIDLRKGECAIAKAGAVSTFIKRGPLVEKISVDSLPLGMMQETEKKEIVCPVRDGDMVILLSDGVVEDWPCMDGEFFLQQQIEQSAVTSPVEMANQLLQYAIGQSQGRIRDDMTVLVVGIWENTNR